MYVCQVKVKDMVQSARWAVCWTERTRGGCGYVNSYRVRTWVSETVARTYAKETECSDGASLVVVIKVVKGHHDELWLNPHSAHNLSVSEINNGWYYAQCYTAVIADEVRKLCDQIQDNVHTEATARP